MQPTTETKRAIEAYEGLPRGAERLVDLLMMALPASFLVIIHRELGERLEIIPRKKQETILTGDALMDTIRQASKGAR